MQPGQLLLILAVGFWSSEERERKRRQRAERSMLISSKDTLTEHHSYPHTTTTTTITTTRKRPQITNSPETQQPDRQVSKSSKQGNGYEMTSCQRSHSCWPGAGSRQAADDDGDEIDDGRPRSRLSKQRSDGSGSQCRRHHFGCHQIKTKTIAAATAAAASETVTSCEKVQLLERHHQADGVPPAWCSREHKGVKFRRRRSVGPVILANDGGGGGLWQRSSLFAYLEVGILLVMSAVVSASQQQSALVPSEDSSGSRSIPSAQEKLQTVSTAASNQNRHEQLDTNIPSLETPSSTKPFNGTLVAGSSRSLASGEDKAAVVGFGNGELELLRRSPWPPRTNSQFDSSTQEAIAAAAAQLGPTGIISVGNDRRGPNIKLANRLASLERQDTGEPVLDATVPISSIQDKNGNNDNEDNNSNNNNNETDDYETEQSAMAPFRLGGERAEHSSSGGSSLTDVLEARSGSIQGKASGGDGNSVGYQVLLVRAHSSAASIRGLSRRRRFDENQDSAGASQMVVGSGGMNSGSGNSGDEPTEQLQAQTISGGWPGDLQAAPASSGGGGTGWAGGELSGAGAQNNPNDVDYNPGSDHEHEHETATGVQVDQVRDPGEGGVDQASHESSLNESANACEELERIVQTRPSKAAGRAFIVCYTIIFIAGLFGNVITLYVLICKGKKRSAQDLLLGNLAISDIMLCVFAVPITPKYLVLDYYWKMGPILCKLVSFTQSVSVYMSTYSLIAIGYIRYRLIVHPLEEAMSHARAFLFCAGTLVIGMLTTAPYVMKVHLSPENCEVKFCDEAWVGSQRFYFSLFTFIFQFVIPLVAVIFFYFNIYRRLDHRTHAGISSSSSTSVATKSQGPSTSHPSTAAATTSGYQQQQAHSNHHHQNTTFEQTGHHQQHVASGVLAIKEIRHRERQRRMKKNNMRLIFVVIIFAHSWLPLNLYNILSDYFDGLSNWAYLTNAFLVAHLIACSSVIWNPILYAWMSDSYQMDLKCAMPKCLAAKFKSCLKEPGHASGHGGGGVGGPTSIVMVSTNGNNHQLHAGTTTTTTTTTNANSISNNNKRFFDFRPSGTGCVAGSTPAPGANPNGLAAADLAGPSQQQQPLQPPSKARSIDQISEVVCLHGLEEQRRELCGQDAADGLAATKSLETLGESKELHEGHHHHCCQGSLTDDDGEGEEEDECDSGTHEIHLANAQMTDSRDNTDTEQYLIDVCRQRVTRLSNGDNNSSQANNIKLRQNNNTSNTTSNNNNNNTNDNNGLEPWT